MNSNSPLQRKQMDLWNFLSQKDCDRVLTYVSMEGMLKRMSQLQPLVHFQREWDSKNIHLYAAPRLWFLQAACWGGQTGSSRHQITWAYRRKGIVGRAWSVSQDMMNNEPGTCREKEVTVCERCVVHLQTHCVHLSYEAVSPLPDTCSVCCSGHPWELQAGPRIAEPQQWTWRNGACSILVLQADAVSFKAGPCTDTALQPRRGML